MTAASQVRIQLHDHLLDACRLLDALEESDGLEPLDYLVLGAEALAGSVHRRLEEICHRLELYGSAKQPALIPLSRLRGPRS